MCRSPPRRRAKTDFRWLDRRHADAIHGGRRFRAVHLGPCGFGQTTERAVLVHFDGNGWPEHVYEKCDTSTIEDQLIEIFKTDKQGDFDGNEVGATENTPCMYGPDAERIFVGIEQTLRD